MTSLTGQVSDVVELDRRAFTASDQDVFATLSGDHNPLHMDPVAARRLMFGQPVVHGVNLVLWALNECFRAREQSVRSLDVSFVRPVFLNEEIALLLEERVASSPRLRVEIAGHALATIRLELIPAESATSEVRGFPSEPNGPVRGPSVPADLTVEEIHERSGVLPITAVCHAIENEWPHLVRATSHLLVSELLSLSRLVGMVCPGLHSVFGGFRLAVGRFRPDSVLSWEVSRLQERLGSLRMGFSGPTTRGTVTAFIRPRPVEQPTTSTLFALVDRGEFSNSRALVIGGSRGLGEVSAKLIAAGGGEAIVGWHRGEKDAEAVVEDIRSSGGRASALQIDTDGPDDAFRRLSEERAPLTHLLYFASPRISSRRLEVFEAAAFVKFSDAYVSGFVRVIESLREHIESDVVAIYPSTAAIEWADPDLVEYSAAKAAGEVVASVLDARNPWLRVLIERLPPLPTDQTASFDVARDQRDPAAVLIELLRRAR